jgi:energy-coupling factor transporter ATP-binding protein EcfA2
LSFDINFISKIYNNRNSYAEIFEDEDLKKIHVETAVEQILREYIEKKKFILLTGNPGDGKTHLIRSLKDLLDKHNIFVEYDFNEVKDYEQFLTDLNNAIKDDRPCIIAVNEYPLISMLDELGDRFPYYHQILELRDNSIMYNNEIAIDSGSSKVVIIDLNNRNLLQKDVLKTSLNKLISLSNICDGCNINKKCDVPYNINALTNATVQERLFELMSMLGNTGTHVVMRDILGFFSYIITAGVTCERRIDQEYMYYNLIFDGNNELFRSLKQFDPYQFTHPEIDEKLWNGTLKEGWIFEHPKVVPSELENEEDANKLFISIKRRFFFENERGSELLKLIPIEYQTFFDLLKQAYDRELDMIKQIVLAINRFFNTDETEDEKLKVWITHKYELRNQPKVAISNKSFSLNEISLLVPRLPNHLQKVEFVPDHFLFRVYKPRDNKTVDLKVDLGFYRVLSLISEGYPPQIVPDNYKFKLYRFMNELASFEDRMRSNEFVIRDMSNNYTYKLIIRDNKYQPKRG